MLSRLMFLILLGCTLWPTSQILSAEPQWIWSNKDAATKAPAGDCAFRKTFQSEVVGSAKLEITADNRYELFVNGRRVGAGAAWQARTKFDIKPLLIPGRNLLAVRATNDGEDPAGLMLSLELKSANKAETIVTDGSWKVHNQPPPGWQRPEFDDSAWLNAAELGAYGKIAPWGAPGGYVEAAATPVVPKSTVRGAFELQDNERLVLLGSAFIERLQTTGAFELQLQLAHPQKKLSVRNLGWSGDTVWGDARAVFGGRADGFKRLVNDVTICRPTAILVCYGENEAFAGEAGLDEFRTGLESLLTALQNTGARLVVVGPRHHENVGPPFPNVDAYNHALTQYEHVLREVARERELAFLSWYDLLPNARLTDNGVHLTQSGQEQIAPALVASLGFVDDSAAKIDLDLARQIVDFRGLLYSQLELRPDYVGFETRLPIRGTTLRVRGLAPGDYELSRIDAGGKSQPVARGGHSEWNQGMPLPADAVVEPLRSAIAEKDFLWFNRYRPQNETYLFLFRKHEQGNNAVEIPQFDPLIDQLDAKIASLKAPSVVKYELKKLGR